MDFIAFDLESEFIFREFFAGLSDLTIKKCGRGCLHCDEAKQGKNKEGEPQQRFNHKTHSIAIFDRFAISIFPRSH